MRATGREKMKGKLAGVLMVIWGLIGLAFFGFRLLSGEYSLSIFPLLDLIFNIAFLVGGFLIALGKEYGFYIGLPVVVIAAMLDAITLSLLSVLVDVAVIGAIVKAYM